MEKTLVLIKPDGVSRGLVGEVLGRFEQKGLKISELKMMQMTDELSDRHYAEHVDKPFYPRLKAFILSGPIVAMVLEGDRAIEVVRRLVGDTDSAEAAPGTIRGDLSLSKGENIIHASDSSESAQRELALFFGTKVVS
ncbi:MAG: nucleoside-diphosphate kinase [Actinobacteria bacterium]|nr:nucleoside-diphosphate kinase [Actinomycetota bacterium]